MTNWAFFVRSLILIDRRKVVNHFPRENIKLGAVKVHMHAVKTSCAHRTVQNAAQSMNPLRSRGER